MATKKAAPKPAPVKIEPSVVLEIDGNKYQLVYTFGSLREAKMMLRGAGININLLHSFSIGGIDADTLPEMLFAGLRVHHPEITFDKALKMLTPANYGIVVDAVAKAYLESVKDPEAKVRKNPPLEPKS